MSKITDIPASYTISHYFGQHLSKKRQGVETVFQCLKGRGHNFEDTHMTFPDRIDKQIALLAVAFSRCHSTGEQSHCQQLIKIKKHGRKAVSLFRLGLDHIAGIRTWTKVFQYFYFNILLTTCSLIG